MRKLKKEDRKVIRIAVKTSIITWAITSVALGLEWRPTLGIVCMLWLVLFMVPNEKYFK